MPQMNSDFIRAMDKARHTYQSLANDADVSAATIKRARQGKQIRSANAWAIADALGKEPQELGFTVA